MAETTIYRIGANVSCSDGFCGEVSRLLINPDVRTITHIVVEPKHRREPGRIVPVNLAEATSGDITLRCTVAEFSKLDLAEETDLVDDGAGYGGGYGQAESVQGYGGTGGMGVGGSVSGMGIGMSLGHSPRTIMHDAVPLGEADVHGGDRVYATDGEIGHVQGFLVNQSDHRITHVLLQEGHLWGRKEVTIPMSAVAGVGYGIKLSITKRQVEDLPPAG